MSPLEKISPQEVQDMIRQMAASLQSLLGEDYRSACMLGIKTGGVLVAQQLHAALTLTEDCLLYTSPSPRDRTRSRMPSSA